MGDEQKKGEKKKENKNIILSVFQICFINDLLSILCAKLLLTRLHKQQIVCFWYRYNYTISMLMLNAHTHNISLPSNDAE